MCMYRKSPRFSEGEEKTRTVGGGKKNLDDSHELELLGGPQMQCVAMCCSVV